MITGQTKAVVTLNTLKPQTAPAVHSNSAEEAQRADWEVEDGDEAKGDGVSKERDERIKKECVPFKKEAQTRVHTHVRMHTCKVHWRKREQGGESLAAQ